MQYSITLKIFSGATQINADQGSVCFLSNYLQIIENRTFFENVISNNNSWREIIADFSKTVEKQEKMRHPLEDSFNMNICTELKSKPKNYFYKDLELTKGKIFKLCYMTFATKIWLCKLCISNLKYFIYFSIQQFATAIKLSNQLNSQKFKKKKKFSQN